MTDAATKIAEIEARRAARREARANAYLEQHAKDLEAVEALEIEVGESLVETVPIDESKWVEGLPTLAAVKAPTSSQFTRFRDMVRKSSGKTDGVGRALDMLGESCLGYPEKETYDRMVETWGGLKDLVNTAAKELGQAEGKG